MYELSPRFRWLAAALALQACAATSASTAQRVEAARPELRSLDEGQALALIDNLLLEARIEPVAGIRIDLPQRRDFRVDLGLGESGVGIEWVSASDRARYGNLLPPPAPEGQLRVLAGGRRDGRPALVLVLDHESYQFATSDRPQASGGELDERDAEHRIRRDLFDFIEYAKTQDRL
jgi:hypothetical protein